MTTVVLADDHAAIRAGVRLILETAQPPIRVVGEASTAQDALEIAARARPDVVLLDVRMPGASGLTVIEALRGTGAAVIMLTSFAPSPIASRIDFWFFLTSLTTKAFCRGDTRPKARFSTPLLENRRLGTYSR